MTDVLLATYNAEAYLEAQLESLLAQTLPVRILVRDDGSTDGTRSILERFRAANPQRIQLCEGQPTGAAKRNFLELVRASDADYMFFCDHDDVWHADKAEKTMDSMRALEAQHTKDKPLLVHTDLAVTTEDGKCIAASLMHYQRMDPRRKALRHLLCQNNVTGCTVMINRALADLFLRGMPQSCIMHDWWLALIAAALGEIGYVDEVTMDYRQHGDNAIGAKHVASFGYVLDRAAKADEVRALLHATCAQAAGFADVFKDVLNAAQNALCRDYAALPQRGKLERVITLCRCGTWKNGILRKVAQTYYI